MQNKPNVKDAQINVNSYMKSKYEKLDTWLIWKNKPNPSGLRCLLRSCRTDQTQFKANLRRARMNVSSLTTEDYRKKDDFVVRINKPNSNPISVKPKMNANVYVIEDYENETTFRPQKNKPKTNPISERPKSLAGKSGHTRRSPMGAIILTFVSVIHILKWFLQGEVK